MNAEHFENVLERLSIFDGLESDIDSISCSNADTDADEFTVHLNIAKSGHQMYHYKDVMPYKFVKQGNNSRKTCGSLRADFIRALDAFINDSFCKDSKVLLDMVHLTDDLIGIAFRDVGNKLNIRYWNGETDLMEAPE